MSFTEALDSERMWIAAQAEKRVCWSIHAESLLDAIRKAGAFDGAFLEKVTYRETTDVDALHRAYTEKYAGVLLKGSSWWEPWRNEVLTPLCTKRREFADEQEHRLVVLDRARDVKRDRAGVEVPVPLRELIQRVRISPSATSDELQNVRTTVEQAGYFGPVVRSVLYQAPSFDHVTEKPIQKEDDSDRGSL